MSSDITCDDAVMMDEDNQDDIDSLVERFRQNEIETIKDDIFDKIQDEIWLEGLRMKCREYIKNNGTKTTTIQEIFSLLEREAFKTFPKDVMLMVLDEIRNQHEYKS